MVQLRCLSILTVDDTFWDYFDFPADVRRGSAIRSLEYLREAFEDSAEPLM